ncbi:unnamed protein product, partial [marine sediment metagenome]
MTQTTHTSREALKQVDTASQQKRIVGAFRVLGVSCIADVATWMRWEKSTVAARMNELRKLEILVFVDKRKSRRTGVLSDHWR